jgi:hypothetical protein
LEISDQLHALAALLPGKETTIPIGYEAGWAPEAVWKTWKEEKSYLYRELNPYPSAVHPVVRRYTNCTITLRKFIWVQSTFMFCIILTINKYLPKQR